MPNLRKKTNQNARVGQGVSALVSKVFLIGKGFLEHKVCFKSSCTACDWALIVRAARRSGSCSYWVVLVRAYVHVFLVIPLAAHRSPSCRQKVGQRWYFDSSVDCTVRAASIFTRSLEDIIISTFSDAFDADSDLVNSYAHHQRDDYMHGRTKGQ